jgi:hypothetical protein
MVARFAAGSFQAVRPPRFRERIAVTVVSWPPAVTERPVILPPNRMKREIIEIQRLNKRLIDEAEQARERAKKLPPGPKRDALLKKARRAEKTGRWLSSSELKPPT